MSLKRLKQNSLTKQQRWLFCKRQSTLTVRLCCPFFLTTRPPCLYQSCNDQSAAFNPFRLLSGSLALHVHAVCLSMHPASMPPRTQTHSKKMPCLQFSKKILLPSSMLVSALFFFAPPPFQRSVSVHPNLAFLPVRV